MFSALLSRLIFLIFGCAYPVYNSYRILSNPLCDCDTLQELYGLVKYFVVFSTYIVLEWFADVFLFWIPFYYEMKVGMIIWMTSPIYGGAIKIYDQFLEPLIRRKEPEIERLIVKFKSIGCCTCYQFSMRLVSRVLSNVLDAALRPSRANREVPVGSPTPLQLVSRRYISNVRRNLNSAQGQLQIDETSSEDEAAITARHDAILKKLKDLKYLRKSHSASK